MAKRNLTIQLDEETIRHAKIVAARRGLSLGSLVAQQLNEPAEADQRYERARAVAPEALAGATGGRARGWRREELHGCRFGALRRPRAAGSACQRSSLAASMVSQGC
jgi:hypothetical protein